MSEMVDSVVGRATTGAPAARPSPAPVPGAAPQVANDAPPKGGNQEFAFRRLQDKMKAGEGEILRLREELAELRGRVGSGQPTPPSRSSPATFGDMDDRQLDEAIAYGMENQNPAAVTAAINEKVARAQRQAAKEARGASTEEYEHSRLSDAIRSKISQDFGQDAFNENGELFTLADKHYAQFIQRYGKPFVLRSPDFLYDAFSRADRELNAGERQRTKELEQEVDRLKRQQALAAGGVVPGARRSQESADALAKGDIRGALKGLRLFKSIESDVRARSGS